MGTTYSNCQVQSDSQDAVAEVLTPLLKEPAYVSPSVGGWVGVYPEDRAVDVDNLAKQLSASLSCGVFAWMVHDSDIFFYTLYEDGKLRDKFDSSPDYFEPVTKAKKSSLSGKPEVLVPYCLPGIGYSQVQAVLHPPPLPNSAETAPAPDALTSLKALPFLPGRSPGALVEALGKLKEDLAQRFSLATFAEEQANALSQLLGIAEDLESCEFRDIAEASRFEANPYRVARQFRLVGTENLSQAYKDAKLLSSFRLDNLKSAVALGADVNARDVSGLPILVKLGKYCAVEKARYLIEMGADVNAATRGTGPDHAGFVLMGVRLEDGVTPLMAAAGASREHPPYQTEMVQALLEAGADVNARSETGRTALGEALKMTDPMQHRKSRRLSEGLSQQAAECSAQVAECSAQVAECSAQVAEMLRAAGATE